MGMTPSLRPKCFCSGALEVFERDRGGGRVLRGETQLPTKSERVVQGPGENAGIIDVGDGWACAFKIESHNHPSYIEPFQGAATGVGGILRDIFTMGARPLAVMDSLRFGRIVERRRPHAPEDRAEGTGNDGRERQSPAYSPTRKLRTVEAKKLIHKN